jgi:phosphatidylglycerophosphate synthase
MRRISPYFTALLARTSIAPNVVTGFMMLSGIGAGAVLLVDGLNGALACAVLVQLYLLLDCSDGELARWTSQTSMTGVYLDRVGHYVAEAALLTGLGARAANGDTDGWMVLGLVAALCATLGKAETDLVDIARARTGLQPSVEQDAEPRNRRIRTLRRVASALRVHRITHAIELSLLIVAAAVYDSVAGGLGATRVLTAACAVVAGVLVVVHLVSILASSRLP